MKSSILLLFAFWVTAASAFVPTISSTAFATRTVITSLRAQVELEPEPEGGEELAAVSTMPDARMKKMEEVTDVSSEDGSPVYQFWLSAIANGDLIKGYRIETLKEAKKNANFPGFRKGQIAPYAMPQITIFAVQESLLKTIESAVKAFGLKSLEGPEGEVTVNEDVEAMCKGYKEGDSLSFTATFKATFDPEVTVAQVSSSSEEAVDVEVE
jgi:hypothetical protein